LGTNSGDAAKNVPLAAEKGDRLQYSGEQNAECGIAKEGGGMKTLNVKKKSAWGPSLDGVVE